MKLTVPDRFLDTLGKDLNMHLIENEANKLHDYCMERGEITDKDVTDICVNPVEDKIFDMCEAISRKDSKKALSLYNDLCILKTKPMTVIFLITRQYNQLVALDMCQQADLNVKTGRLTDVNAAENLIINLITI